ncbi:MAG: hypothetical protein QW812_04100 [Thermoplasmataceae archaeon]
MQRSYSDLPQNILNYQPRILGMKAENSLVLVLGVFAGVLLLRYYQIAGLSIVFISIFITFARIRRKTILEILHDFIVNFHFSKTVEIEVSCKAERSQWMTDLWINGRNILISEIKGQPLFLKRFDDQTSFFRAIAGIMDGIRSPFYLAAVRDPLGSVIDLANMETYQQLVLELEKVDKRFSVFIYCLINKQDAEVRREFEGLIQDLAKLGFDPRSVSLERVGWLNSSL